MTKKHKGISPNPEESSPYKVGYGKTPVETRFKKGQSGNPKGRPKKKKLTPEEEMEALVPKTTLKKALAETISIKVGDQMMKTSKFDALVKKLVNDALGGDKHALRTLVQLQRDFKLHEITERSAKGIQPLVVKHANLNNDHMRQIWGDHNTRLVNKINRLQTEIAELKGEPPPPDEPDDFGRD